MNNKFLIIIAGRNNEKWVKSNLESVLIQDYPYHKTIFFDDASEDETCKIAHHVAGKTNPKFTWIFQPERKAKTWFFANLEHYITIDDNDILVFLDGDDFLACENALSYLNEIYNQTQCWMTYGGMLVWNGNEDYSEPFPQNSCIPEQIKETRSYRKDIWRTSHLKTMRGFLWKRINKLDLIPYGTPMIGPDDLAIMFAAMEMTPSDKIYQVKDSIYIYNHSPENNRSRAFTEHKESGIDYEHFVRSIPPYKPISIVSPTLAGGLGNQMFEIAAAASLAKDNNALLMINPNEHILPNQGKNVNNYLDNIFEKIATDTATLCKTEYSWEYPYHKAIPFQPDVKLRGHYQSFKYFDHNREYIQNLFTPRNFKPIYNEHTAIQVRRGDYKRFPDHHPLLPPEYFVNTAKSAGSKQIFIFSDDLEWCKDNLNFGEDYVVEYVKKSSDWEELLSMTEFKNLIISNSSFGWWAAYLNTRKDKQIFAPSIWFGPAIAGAEFNINDLILPEWHKIQI